MSGGWQVRITTKIPGGGISERLFHAAYADRGEAEDAVRAYDDMATSDFLAEAISPLTERELLQRGLKTGQVSQWGMTKFSRDPSNTREARPQDRD
jgi:hypothetical protein